MKIPFLLLLLVFVSVATYCQTIVNIKTYGAIGNGVHYDDTAITSALAYAGSHSPANVIIPIGTYRISNTTSSGEAELVFQVPSNVKVIATDAIIGDTTSTGGLFCFRLSGKGSAFINGLIRKGRIEVRTSNAVVDGVRCEYSWYHAFHVDGDRNAPTTLYKNIVISDCVAYRSRRHGFAMHRQTGSFTRGSDSVGNFQNVQFINDKAYQSDFYENGTFYSPYDYGFGMENIISATDVLFRGCLSYQSASAGWHIENNVAVSGIAFIGDTAQENGVAARQGGYSPFGSGSYPCGFMYKGGFDFQNCVTINNYFTGWLSISPFIGGVYRFSNCNEQGYSPFSYSSVSDQGAWTLNLDAYGGAVCSTIFAGGAPSLPMKGLPMNLFSIYRSQEPVLDGSGKLYSDARNVIFNDSSLYDASYRYTSIASHPIKVDTSRTYAVKIDMRTINGSTGTPYLYVQEFGKNDSLINHGANHYLVKQSLASVQDTAKTFTILFGHGAISFATNAVYARVTLVLAETAADNKRYAVSGFSVLPQ